MSENTLTKSEQRHAAEVLDRYGMPAATSTEVSAVVDAIGAADKASLLDVIRDVAHTVYVDPSAAEADARLAFVTSQTLSDAGDRMRVVGTYIVRAAKAVDPSVSLVSVGMAAEQRDESDGALKQRWSRFGLAVDLVDRSNASVSDGKRKRAISLKSALHAAYNASETRAALRAMASAGADMPTGGRVTGEQSGNDGQVTQRVYSPADVLRAAQTLCDRAKRMDKSKVTPEIAREIDAAISKARALLAGEAPAVEAG